MANVQDVDLEAIKMLLLTNNIQLPYKNTEIYDKALNLMNIRSTSYENVPVTIIDGCWLTMHRRRILLKILIILEILERCQNRTEYFS